MPRLAIMFPASSIVKHVQNDDENNRFYAQAEVKLAEDLDHAELQLRDPRFKRLRCSVNERKGGSEHLLY